MINFSKKTSVLVIFVLLFSTNGSGGLESKDQDQSYQVKKNLQISKGLATAPDYGKLPLYFIPNEGQVNEKALFFANTSNYALWLTREGLVFDSIKRIAKKNDEFLPQFLKEICSPENQTYERNVMSLIFLNSNKNSDIVPLNQTEYKVNYFIGCDESKWRTNIRTSRAVLYKELFRNIDLKVYGIEREIEYEFIVKPNGDVSDICFELRGVEKSEIGKEGDLIISTKFGQLQHAEPVCYQDIGGEYVEVAAEFKELKENTYSFNVNEYDENYELIIDPLILAYSTYLGGCQYDKGEAIALDSEGAAYITGITSSADFPVQNPFQQNNKGTGYDCFVTKLSPTGTTLVYSTYLGGTDLWDFGRGIAVDSQGAVYVTGRTSSIDFPTRNPIQEKLAGGFSDAFITKIDTSGSVLVYSTYLGGSGDDGGISIEVDSEGAAYIAGSSSSTDFPVQNPFQAYRGGGDIFITKINPTGTALDYSTYLGGSSVEWCNDMALDSEGSTYVTGETLSKNFPLQNPVQNNYMGGKDCFVAKLDSSGTALGYSTYLGGSGEDEGGGIDVDSEGAAYITGYTLSNDFPLQNPLQGSNGGSEDVFICKLNSSGSSLVFSTYLGGIDQDGGCRIAVDLQGAIYVTGKTSSFDFPIQNPIRQNITGYGYDGFVIKLNPAGSNLRYSTYLGGDCFDHGNDIKVDTEGAAYVTGWTNSFDFPIQNPFQGSIGGLDDAFITKLCLNYSLILETSRGGTTDPLPGIYDFYDGCKVTIKAIPDKGYSFSHWSGDVSGKANPISATMDSDKSIKANFVRQEVLTIESNEGGTTDPPPGVYTYDIGTEVMITAIPDSSYRFSHWSGDISSTASSLGKYTSNPETKIVKIAMSEIPLRFNEIRENVPSTDNPIVMTMDSDKSIKAIFIKQHTLTLATNGGGTTIPSPGIYTYDKGTKVTFTAIPQNHFSFSHWGGDVSGTDNPKTITINSDMFLTANFVRLIYPPLNVTGEKVLNRSLSQAEYINVLNWAANPNNVDIVKYRIYQLDGENRSVLIELNASTFQYWHRRVEKDKRYSYLICCVDSEDREGSPAQISIQ